VPTPAVRTAADTDNSRHQWHISETAVSSIDKEGADSIAKEAADSIAKEAADLSQRQAPVDVQTMYRAADRATKATSVREWPVGW